MSQDLRPQTFPSAPREVPRILAVDDDPIQREFYGIYFAPPDVQLTAVEGGAAALALLDVAPFSAAIVDYEMPGMDGLELTRRLRADPRFGDRPIIVVTGRYDLVTNNAAVAAGATATVYKPVNWRELSERVRLIIRQDEAMRALAPRAGA